MVQVHQHIENIKTWRTLVVVSINYKLTTKRVPRLWLVIPWYVVLIWFHRGELHGGSAKANDKHTNTPTCTHDKHTSTNTRKHQLRRGMGEGGGSCEALGLSPA